MQNHELSTVTLCTTSGEVGKVAPLAENSIEPISRERFRSAGLLELRLVRPGDAESGAEHGDTLHNTRRGRKSGATRRKQHRTDFERALWVRGPLGNSDAFAQEMQNRKLSTVTLCTTNGEVGEGIPLAEKQHRTFCLFLPRAS